MLSSRRYLSVATEFSIVFKWKRRFLSMWSRTTLGSIFLRPISSHNLAGSSFLRRISRAMTDDSSEIIRDGAPWAFRGEGNSSLVLSSARTRTILRLRKVRTSSSKDGHTSMSDHKSSLQGIVNYVDYVIRPMLPCRGWIPKMRVLHFPEREIPDWHQLVHEAKGDRDVSRVLDKHALHQEAIFMRDLCFLPDFPKNKKTEKSEKNEKNEKKTFSVELKPKEGVLPRGEGVHPARQKISKYRMKQQMKLKNGTIKQANEYDPLDLFSGNDARMLTSLHTLVHNPQNNFRIFLDGVVQFDSRSSGFANFASVAAKVLPPATADPAETLLNLVLIALKKPMSTETKIETKTQKEKEKEVKTKTENETKTETKNEDEKKIKNENETNNKNENEIKNEIFLSQFSILGGLLNAQNSCKIDIEPLHPQYVEVCRLFQDQPTLRGTLGVDGPDYGNAPFWTGEHLESLNLSAKNEEFIANCRSYLATSTVKDCSVFLTFQNVDSTNSVDSTDSVDSKGSTDSVSCLPVIEVSPGVSFTFFASLVDLDPKPFERIEKHFVESQKLIELAQHTEE